MVQSRFRGKDDCVYCDQPFLVHVCLFGWWGVLVFGWELLLSEFLFNHLDRTACVLPVKHEYTRQFMAGKTLSQLYTK